MTTTTRTRGARRCSFRALGLGLVGAMTLAATRGATALVSDGACEYLYAYENADNAGTCGSQTTLDACQAADDNDSGLTCLWSPGDTACSPWGSGSGSPKNTARAAALSTSSTDPATVALWKLHNSCKLSGKTGDDCDALPWCVDGEELLSTTSACQVDYSKFLSERCGSSSTYAASNSNVTAKASFNGITSNVDTTMINKLVTALLKSTIGDSGVAPTPTLSYVVSGKQTYSARVDEADFRTKLATALGVAESTISNIAQSMTAASGRRLLSSHNTVSYDFTTTAMGTANTARAYSSAVTCDAETSGTLSGTAGAATTAVKMTLVLTVDSSIASSVESTIGASGFTTTLATAVTAAGGPTVTVTGNEAATTTSASSTAGPDAFKTASIAVMAATTVALLL